MKVIKNYLYNASYQVFILIVPLITTPYLARVLGPTGVGINSYTNSIIQYFILFGSIGVGLYGSRQIAFVRDDKKKLTRTFYELFLMRLVTILIACVAFGGFLMMVDQYQTYYLVQGIAIIAAAFDVSWFFIGVENIALTVMRSLVVKIITLISIFIFVKTEADLMIYILTLSVSLLAGNILLIPGLKRYLSKPIFSQLKIWQHLWPSLALFIPQIATQVYLVVNKTMLGAMVSVRSAGYFDQSDKMVKIVLAIVTALGTVMLPRIANEFAKGRYEKVKEYLYSSFSFVTALAVPMAFGLAAISIKFVPLFFTAEFKVVAPIMMIESIVILLIAWSNVVGVQYLLPTKQTQAFTKSVMIGAAVNLVINLPLIVIHGAIGAAIATVISELTVTGYQLWILRKQISYKKLFSDIHKYLIAGLVMFVIVFQLNQILTDNWLGLLLEVMIGISVYLVLLILLKTKIMNKLTSRMKLKHA